MSESDFAEFIRILRRHRVRFLVIGGYAMAHHGLVRATSGVDVLVAIDEDVTTKIDGIADFERAWRNRSKGEFFGVPAGFLSLEDMRRTKRAAGRPRDLGDLDWLVREIARRRKPAGRRRRS